MDLEVVGAGGERRAGTRARARGCRRPRRSARACRTRAPARARRSRRSRGGRRPRGGCRAGTRARASWHGGGHGAGHVRSSRRFPTVWPTYAPAGPPSHRAAAGARRARRPRLRAVRAAPRRGAGGVVVLHGAGSQKENHFDFARACAAAGLAAVVVRPARARRERRRARRPRDRRRRDDRGACCRAAGPSRCAARSWAAGSRSPPGAALDAAAVVAICPASGAQLAHGLADRRFAFRADPDTLAPLLGAIDLPSAAAGARRAAAAHPRRGRRGRAGRALARAPRRRARQPPRGRARAATTARSSTTPSCRPSPSASSRAAARSGRPPRRPPRRGRSWVAAPVSRALYDRLGVGYTTTRHEDPRIAAAIHAALGDARERSSTSAPGPARTSRPTGALSRSSPRR